MREVVRFRGKTLGDRREHFGFRDGLTQPDPEDLLLGWRSDPGREIVAPGEFIRGCRAEEGHRALERGVEAWERYGSYVVFRRLRQDVDGFWTEMAKTATALNAEAASSGVPFHATAENVAAKVVGRWPSGVKLGFLADGTFPTEDPGKHLPWPLNATSLRISRADFAGDLHGAACPLFAHIRKSNTRDARPTDSVAAPSATRFHKILRRGIPYEDESGKGLLFLAYQASIEEGAEFIQRNWMNDHDFSRFREHPSSFLPGIDALIGQQVVSAVGGPAPPPSHAWYLSADPDQHAPISQRLSGFVAAEGGGYFFSPALDVLSKLAAVNDAG